MKNITEIRAELQRVVDNDLDATVRAIGNDEMTEIIAVPMGNLDNVDDLMAKIEKETQELISINWIIVGYTIEIEE